MLDIDFLSSSLKPSGLFVYRYRTGYLREKIKNALLRNVSNPEDVVEVSEERFVLRLVESNTGFFSEVIFCDFEETDEKKKRTETEFERLLDCLIDNASKKPILFISSFSHFKSCPKWEDVKKVGLVVDEIEITESTLADALRFIEATTDLAEQPDFTSQEGFIESFVPLLDDEPDLLKLMHAFDDRVLTCTDPLTNIYDSLPHQVEMARNLGRGSPLQSLRAFVGGQDGWDLVSLVAVLDERRFRRGWTGIKVVRALFRATSKMLASPNQGRVGFDAVRNGGGPKASSPKREIAGCLWGIVLLAWESRLAIAAESQDDWLRPTCDSLTVVLDQVGRDFLTRSKAAHRSDPSEHLVQALSQTLARSASPRDPLANAREKLLESLLNAMLPWTEYANLPWIKNFRQRFGTREIVKASDQNNGVEREVKTSRSDPPSFDEIIGQANVVRNLRRRLRQGHRGTGLILHGPEGVGKRTMGRLYAKSLMCDAPLSSGLACGECIHCKVFAQGGQPLGFVAIDTNAVMQTDQVKYAVDKAGTGSISPQRATMITNIDTFASTDADRMLKTVEDGDVPFILTTSDLSTIRAAILSRSDAFELNSFTQEQARKQLIRFLLALDIECEEHVLDFLVAYSECLPGKIIQASRIVAGLTHRDIESIRSALGWEWVRRATTYWGNVLGAEAADAKQAFEPAHEDITLRQLQVFLYHIRLFISQPNELKSPICDTGFIRFDPGISRGTVDLLVRRAGKLQQTPEDLWRKLAELWTSVDIINDDPRQMFDRSRRCMS